MKPLKNSGIQQFKKDFKKAEQAKFYLLSLIKNGKQYYLKDCEIKNKKPQKRILYEIDSFILNQQ